MDPSTNLAISLQKYNIFSKQMITFSMCWKKKRLYTESCWRLQPSTNLNLFFFTIVAFHCIVLMCHIYTKNVWLLLLKILKKVDSYVHVRSSSSGWFLCQCHSSFLHEIQRNDLEMVTYLIHNECCAFSSLIYHKIFKLKKEYCGVPKHGQIKSNPIWTTRVTQ